MFFRAVHIIEHLSRNRAERALPHGMQMSHFSVLSHLRGLAEPTTPATLAATFQVARPSMTNTLQKLAAKGFVEIQPNPKDGRGKVVKITRKGCDIHSQALQTIGPLFGDIVDALGEKTFAELLPNLTTIQQYLDDNR